MSISCQYIYDTGKIAAPHTWCMRQYPTRRKRHRGKSI
jgi:hypothetical protein